MTKDFLPGAFRSQQIQTTALLLALTFMTVAVPSHSTAQNQDDPPSRVARLGYIEGSVSFQPAGESGWVEAVPNRPMTTADKLWVDQNSRAEVQLGSATVDLSQNTGFSFLNLDDMTVQIQLTAGEMNVRVGELDQGNVFEIDTPNQAFTVAEPGRYRVEASEDGSYTVITIRQGSGESTGNGQSYSLHASQRTTFSGTTSLNAEVENLAPPDDFDNWADTRYRRYDESPSARYCSHDMVGYYDMDNNGDWRPHPQYGNVWFPRVEAGWAPYHDGHWAWIDPWGWTWVDDASWGYAPFHYGRWLWVDNRWGWIPGPVAQRPVYAPALVVFVGGAGPGFGGNVAWFPLGPREVYVPTYPVSQAYVTRVNVSNTTVNVTQVTNVYNTVIVNKTMTITNVTYVNRTVQGAVTAVPQRAFASAQPVAKAAVTLTPQQVAAAPISVRAAVPPAQAAVFGLHANSAGHVAFPPPAVASRVVIAKTAPPPPPPPFSDRQQVLAQHPGQAIPRQQLQKMAPPAAATSTLVKRAPPAKPATATPKAANAQPATRPGNLPAAPAQAQPPQPTYRPAESAARGDRPPSEQKKPATRPQPSTTAPPNRPSNGLPPNQGADPKRLPDAHPEVTSPARPKSVPETNRPGEEHRPTEPARPQSPPSNLQKQSGRPAPEGKPVTPPKNSSPPKKPEDKKQEDEKNSHPQ